MLRSETMTHFLLIHEHRRQNNVTSTDCFTVGALTVIKDITLMCNLVGIVGVRTKVFFVCLFKIVFKFCSLTTTCFNGLDAARNQTLTRPGSTQVSYLCTERRVEFKFLTSLQMNLSSVILIRLNNNWQFHDN